MYHVYRELCTVLTVICTHLCASLTFNYADYCYQFTLLFSVFWVLFSRNSSDQVRSHEDLSRENLLVLLEQNLLLVKCLFDANNRKYGNLCISHLLYERNLQTVVCSVA